MKNVNIRQIVRLKQVVRRWMALNLRPRHGGSGSGRHDQSVRAGFLAVYVGQQEQRRFEIPTRFLKLPVFAALLQRAEEEYGFPSAGSLVLPCDPGFFRCIIDMLNRDEARHKFLTLEAFLALFANVGAATAASPCRESASYGGSLLSSPRLRLNKPEEFSN